MAEMFLQLVEKIAGTEARVYIQLIIVTIFALALLVERFWFLNTLKSKVDQMEKSLPALRTDVDEAKRKADEALTKTSAYVNMLDNLQEAVLDIPNLVREGVLQGVRLSRGQG